MTPIFNEEKNGYNKREVDQYIDVIRAEYEKAVALNNQLTARVYELEQANARAQEAAVAAQAAEQVAQTPAGQAATTQIQEAPEQGAVRSFNENVNAPSYEGQAVQNKANEESLKDIGLAMVTAQEYAREIEQKAKEDYNRVLQQAEDHAATITLKANESLRKAEQIVNDAEYRAKQIVESATRQHRSVHNKLNEIVDALNKTVGGEDAYGGISSNASVDDIRRDRQGLSSGFKPDRSFDYSSE